MLSIFEIPCGYIAGLWGGMASLSVGHPLDTIKVTQQSRSKNTSTWHIILQIQKKQGIWGFYRGISFPLIASGLMNSAFFGTYELSATKIEVFSSQSPSERIILERNLANGTVNHHDFTASTMLMAGGIAGVTQVLIGCPVELIKIKMQTHQATFKDKIPPGSMYYIHKIYKKHGITGLYQGSMSMSLRETVSSSIYMFVYFRGSKMIKDNAIERKLFKDKQHEKMFYTFMGGGAAGLASWWAVLPVDVIKSKLQADSITNPKYSGVFGCIRQIKLEEGYRGFLKGFVPLTIRAFPVNGAAFLAYEWFVDICKDLQRKGKGL